MWMAIPEPEITEKHTEKHTEKRQKNNNLLKTKRMRKPKFS